MNYRHHCGKDTYEKYLLYRESVGDNAYCLTYRLKLRKTGTPLKEVDGYEAYKKKRGDRALKKYYWYMQGKPDRPTKQGLFKKQYEEYVDRWGDKARSRFCFWRHKDKYGLDVAMNTPKLTHGGDRQSKDFVSLYA